MYSKARFDDPGGKLSDASGSRPAIDDDLLVPRPASAVGLVFRHHAIGADRINTGFNQILFDGRHGLRETVERGVNLVHTALFARHQRQIGAVRRAQIRRAGGKGFLDFAGIAAADVGERGQHDGAIRHERLERVILGDRRTRPAESRREMAKNDFLQHEFKQLNLAVTFDEPLERLRKLIELLRAQLPQRAQREIDDRQMRVRGGRRNIGIQRNSFRLDCRFNAFGQFGELRRARCFIRTEQHRVNQCHGIQRFASGGFYAVRQ